MNVRELDESRESRSKPFQERDRLEYRRRQDDQGPITNIKAQRDYERLFHSNSQTTSKLADQEKFCGQSIR
jgi:hypothetical protein